ncbi:MAG: hypothetical protein C5S38_00290 [Candidatus Methanophagaceae archaeon]|nr:MAG: hypothetical protein C5S38_00290 [Methanophagales archaeon]
MFIFVGKRVCVRCASATTQYVNLGESIHVTIILQVTMRAATYTAFTSTFTVTITPLQATMSSPTTI